MHLFFSYYHFQYFYIVRSRQKIVSFFFCSVVIAYPSHVQMRVCMLNAKINSSCMTQHTHTHTHGPNNTVKPKISYLCVRETETLDAHRDDGIGLKRRKKRFCVTDKGAIVKINLIYLHVHTSSTSNASTLN